MSRTTLKNLHEEIKVLSNLPESNHIIGLRDTIKTTAHYYLIMEYCNGGDLENLLGQRMTLKEKEV